MRHWTDTFMYCRSNRCQSIAQMTREFDCRSLSLSVNCPCQPIVLVGQLSLSVNCPNTHSYRSFVHRWRGLSVKDSSVNDLLALTVTAGAGSLKGWMGARMPKMLTRMTPECLRMPCPAPPFPRSSRDWRRWGHPWRGRASTDPAPCSCSSGWRQ